MCIVAATILCIFAASSEIGLFIGTGIMGFGIATQFPRLVMQTHGKKCSYTFQGKLICNCIYNTVVCLGQQKDLMSLVGLLSFSLLEVILDFYHFHH